MLARVQLGKSFAVRAQAKTLVTAGLYSKFRHPIYLFGEIAYLGLFISWGKLVPLLCFLLIYPVEILRARKEERVLEQALGEEYRRYKASTWF
jgi:protein-S-isoprenylcysteine O-methyltransferase Ste14